MKTMTKPQANPPATQAAEETRWLLPSVNVFELKDAYVIEAEMPGVQRNGLEITLEGNTLTLTGRRTVEAPPGQPLYVESKPASFRRVFELDPTVNTGKTSARIENGLLTLQLPKADEIQPQRIQVTG